MVSIIGLIAQFYYFNNVRIGGTICVLTMIPIGAAFIVFLEYYIWR